MIYAGADKRRLALLRIALYAVWLVHLVREPFPDLAAFPRAWFTPCGPWLLLPEAALRAVWNEPALRTLQFTTFGCIALALVGAPYARLWAGLGTFLLVWVASFVRGFGHVDHAEIQLLLVTIALCCVPAWDALCLRGAARDSRPAARAPTAYATSFVVLALVFGLPYFLTAAYRLTHEGAAIFAGPSMQLFIARDSLMLDHFDFTLGLDLLRRPAWLPVLQLGFFATTLAELAAPFAYLNRRVCALWLLVIVPFHVLAPLLMHVLFAHNLAALALLYAWPLAWNYGRVAQPLAREKYSTSPIDSSS